MMSATSRLLVFLVVFGLFLGMRTPEAFAQARPSARPVKAGDGVVSAAASKVVEIKQIEGIGAAGRAKTPDFTTSPSENNNQPGEWAKILTHFKTTEEWVDELEFRYFVLVKNSKSNVYTLFTATVVHMDIAKGTQHMSSMFLRPRTVERYGVVERVAVEIYYKGELAALASNPEDNKPWWRTANVKTVEGVLLNRSQTPFAAIAYDNYENIKMTR